MKYITASLLTLFVLGLMIPSAFAEVPDWVKNTAGWWATDAISETEFLNAIEFLVNKEIIQVSDTTSDKDGSGYVPSWIKNNAGWWADGQIDDSSFVLGLQWLITNEIIIVEEKLIHTDADFRVAFIGDQGHNPQSIAVLNLIKDEGAQMVLHQGDFDYNDVSMYGGDPDAWDKMISDVLGDDFPYFGTIGQHDSLKWNEYQQKLYDRLKKNPDVNCIGDLGVKSSCSYKGLLFIQAGPALKGSGHSSFIENQLNNNDHIWRICTWAATMHHMQLGQKEDKVGWEVYENCKNGAAIIATAHEHSYSRTKTLIDIENQIVDPEWSEPDKLRVKEGSTFVFVSGLGGKSIRDQERCLPASYPYGCNGEWASIYTSDQSADFGALFCTFNAGGNPNKADCYFKNIQGKIIDKFIITNFVGIDDTNSNLPEIDLSNKDLSGRDLTETLLIGADLSDTNLTGADLSGKYLADTILTGADLSNSNLTGADLSGKYLADTILTGADLSNSNLTGADLSGKDLTGMILIGADLTDVDITGTILRGADLTRVNLTGADLSDRDLTGTVLIGADLTGVNLTGVDLSVMDLTYANLSGQDLSSKDLTKTILSAADLSDTILPYGVLSGKNFVNTKFNGVDLSGKDLSSSKFQYARFNNANMKNTNLSNTELVQVDFTKIKNKSLAGSDLSGTSFAHSDLSGVNLDGATLSLTNFNYTNLEGQDFTALYRNQILGSAFNKSNLSDANFEGVDLGATGKEADRFDENIMLTDGAWLATKSLEDLTYFIWNKDIFGTLVVDKKVVGNDLLLKIIRINAFDEANLQNVNFSNANLTKTSMKKANLAGADLSGADLSGANLQNANLSGANLQNANLSGANLQNANLSGVDLSDVFIDENTNLNCKNHPICLND